MGINNLGSSGLGELGLSGGLDDDKGELQGRKKGKGKGQKKKEKNKQINCARNYK